VTEPLVRNSTPRYKKTRPIGHCESKWCLCTLPRNLANFVTFFSEFFYQQSIVRSCEILIRGLIQTLWSSV